MIESRDINYWKNEILKYSTKTNNLFKSSDDRIKLSEEILSGLRGFCEATACFIYKNNYLSQKFDKRFDEIENAIRYCQNNSNLNFISIFYEFLNASVGHENFYDEYAVRLTFKYINPIIKIKTLLKNSFNIDILTNLSKYPLDLDSSFGKYYDSISKLLSKNDVFENNGDKDTYYIQKKKMIFTNNVLFYEYTITSAIDKSSKNNRILVFSLLDIPTNYAVQISIIEKNFSCFDVDTSCKIITDYRIAIRQCEIEKICKVLGFEIKGYSKNHDYYRLMEYFKKYNKNFVDIIKLDNDNYKQLINDLFPKKTILFQIIELSRKKYLDNVTGIKTLLYLLFKMNNQIIKKQLPFNEETSLSTLYLNKGVYSFEKTPFSSGLINHVPKFYDLICLFDFNEHREEYFAKKLSNASNENNCIYIDKETFECLEIDNLFEKYNLQFYKDNLISRKILKIGNNYYLNEYEINTIKILKYIKKCSKSIYFTGYHDYANAKIDEKNMQFDDEKKKEALLKLFDKGSVFAVYGPAGTGKSFFAGLVLSIFDNLEKICIASTNPAVDNMKRKFNDNTATYLTITKFLNQYKGNEIDLLVIDECSNVSAKDMVDILENTKPKLLLLLGDIFQIQPINFGNWFALLREFMEKDYYIDLDSQFRTTNTEVLIPFWNEVRDLSKNNKIIELASMYQISHKFDSSIFIKEHKDEIILCLNYDGLYGINNFNKILQKLNPEKEFNYKHFTFKKDDPIVFEENEQFKGLFYNNLKGDILDISENVNSFIFKIRVYTILASITCQSYNVKFEGIENYNNQNCTIVSFKIEKYSSEVYERDNDNVSYIPFQIAYAMSIHKAQGLEYDSVKIIISNEVEENISHNIFYTAITRARKNLTIYWSEETEHKVIESFSKISYKKDASIIKKKYPELKNK